MVQVAEKTSASTAKDDAQQLEVLWTTYKRTSDPNLRNILIERYYPLVRYIGERLLATLPKSIDLEDLISAGLFGLMDAIDGFDLSRGIKFKTYCTTRIRGSILDELRSQDWVPRLVRLKANKIRARTTTQAIEVHELLHLLDDVGGGCSQPGTPMPEAALYKKFGLGFPKPHKPRHTRQVPKVVETESKRYAVTCQSRCDDWIQAVQPGEEFELEIEMHFTSWVFPAGHRVRFSIANSQWPMMWPTPYAMTTSLRLGGDTGSHVYLPIVPAAKAPEYVAWLEQADPL